MHFGWNFELLYCRWCFFFFFFFFFFPFFFPFPPLSFRIGPIYFILYLDILRVYFPFRTLNVIPFACNRMSWRAGNKTGITASAA
jgi:hypothetical protein